MRHRVAARASREWPRGEKRKGSPRVAPPAAGGGKSLSLLRRERVSDPRDMPAGPPPPSLLPSSPLGRRFHPPPGRHHRALPGPTMPSPVSPSPAQLRPPSRERTPPDTSCPPRLSRLPFSSATLLPREQLSSSTTVPTLQPIPHLATGNGNLSPFDQPRRLLVSSSGETYRSR